MILNFIWTIAISSVFPMLILLGMILGIEFANHIMTIIAVHLIFASG